MVIDEGYSASYGHSRPPKQRRQASHAVRVPRGRRAGPGARHRSREV